MEWSHEIIRSRQNRSVVELCRLSDRKVREERRLFRFDGVKLYEEACKNGVGIDTVVLRERSAETLRARLHERLGRDAFEGEGRVILLSDELFDKISEEKSPEGIITIAKYIDKFQKFATIYNGGDFLKAREGQIVLLESVRDPTSVPLSAVRRRSVLTD